MASRTTGDNISQLVPLPAHFMRIRRLSVARTHPSHLNQAAQYVATVSASVRTAVLARIEKVAAGSETVRRYLSGWPALATSSAGVGGCWAGSKFASRDWCPPLSGLTLRRPPPCHINVVAWPRQCGKVAGAAGPGPSKPLPVGAGGLAAPGAGRGPGPAPLPTRRGA